jgi:hypothetical protein
MKRNIALVAFLILVVACATAAARSQHTIALGIDGHNLSVSGQVTSRTRRLISATLWSTLVA